ncbi:MAG: Ca-activated chloride channel family protein [Planctomycetota bacterium]|jgi:Ca-activated chloride channel family protein
MYANNWRGRTKTMAWRTLVGAGALLGALAVPASAQSGLPSWQNVSHVIVPQARAYAMFRERGQVSITSIEAKVSIRERTARTTLDIYLANSGRNQAEAVLLLPVPEGAVVAEFLFDGSALEPTARLLPAAAARATYDDIVRRMKDPALLEFAGYNLVRSSVFPVPAGGKQHLRLSYDHILTVDGDRVDYLLPRSEVLTHTVPWKIQVEIDEERPISVVYSPSHELERSRTGGKLRLRSSGKLEPGAFHLSYLLEGAGISASFLGYPDPAAGGGYFMLMAGLPVDRKDPRSRTPREVTLVLDRSGSMAGEKLDQTLAAASQVIESLDPDETFNIIDYASQVDMFASSPVPKTRKNVLAARQYMANIRPTGGTNIHDALLASLRQKVTPGHLPIVLFLTDGLPTVGLTSEIEIRDMVKAANTAHQRIFTIGVGKDVNVPLLDRISDESRALGTYVLPGEDVETKVAGVFKRLSGPLLSQIELEVFDESGQLTTRALREMFPSPLPDLFEGDPLVLLGQYRGVGKLRFRMTGVSFGKRRSFEVQFDLAHASVSNSFVPRLWAGRKIAYLVDEIRQAGARAGGLDLSKIDVFADPRFKELAEEILRLSTRFGILSEYTSFLATEGTRLDDWALLTQNCRQELNDRAVQKRFGESAVNQGKNFNRRKAQTVVDYSNTFWNEDSKQVSFSGVQQVCDRAFYHRGGQWVDSNLVGSGDKIKPETTVIFGSDDHAEILRVLVSQGRQGLLSLQGDILLQFEGKSVLVQNTNH